MGDREWRIENGGQKMEAEGRRWGTDDEGWGAEGGLID